MLMRPCLAYESAAATGIRGAPFSSSGKGSGPKDFGAYLWSYSGLKDCNMEDMYQSASGAPLPEADLTHGRPHDITHWESSRSGISLTGHPLYPYGAVSHSRGVPP
jgi:hypothetical protein